jgi:hypothetical protein
MEWLLRLFGKRPKTIRTPEQLKPNHIVGGHWGNHISWYDHRNWDEIDLLNDTIRMYGHKHIIPNVGELIQAEFENSGKLLFEIVKVKQCWDPKDMFFCDVKLIQEHKSLLIQG